MTEDTEQKKGWWSRLKDGLKRSSDTLTEGLKTVFIKRKLDQETLDDLEDLLLQSDMGVETSATLTKELARQRMDQDISIEEVKTVLAQSVEKILAPVAKPLIVDIAKKPHVILVIGVNGAGKTTTISKLAKQWSEQGLSVTLVAGDTFRAAAVEQLQVWGDRLGLTVVKGPAHADAAGLAYEAFQQAKAEKTDVLLIDTAGRLHNKSHLMAELEKIVRVLKKMDPEAPHTKLLILDGTTGQNAHNQVQTFKDIIGVDGLIITKLDGTAKGGVVVSLAQKFGIPIYAIGVGETADDLKPFTSEDFSRTLLGVE